jgi:lysyl-tRNA synthetase class I
MTRSNHIAAAATERKPKLAPKIEINSELKTTGAIIFKTGCGPPGLPHVGTLRVMMQNLLALRTVSALRNAT